MVKPSDKFIDRWAKIYIHRFDKSGRARADMWANRTLNLPRDGKRIKARIYELRGTSPS